MTPSRGPGRRGWAWVSSGIGLFTTVLYVVVIVQEGDNRLGEILPWVAVMTAGVAAMVTSAVVDDARLGRAAAVTGVLILGAVGVLGILSIGTGFLIAALAGLVAAAQVSPRRTAR